MYPRNVIALVFAFGLQGASAATVTSEAPVPKDQLFSAIKRYLLLHSQGGRDLFALEDREAGFLRFRYEQDGFTEPSATAEVIESDASNAKLRLTLPGDFAGRAQILSGRMLKEAAAERGKTVPFEAKGVFPAVLRFILRELVPSGRTKDQVILKAEEDVGFVRFVFVDRQFRDEHTSVEVIPADDKSSRVVVTVPSDPSIRRLLLEEKILQAVKEDLGGREATPTPPPAP